MANEESDKPAGESYHIGDVAAYARVQQGKHLTMIDQTFVNTPGSDDLVVQFRSLLDKIAKHPDLDEDSRDLAIQKTQEVAEGLANAKESPSRLKRSLLDAKGWFSSTMNWAWEEVSVIMKSEAAQKTIATIAESSVKGAITSLL